MRCYAVAAAVLAALSVGCAARLVKDDAPCRAAAPAAARPGDAICARDAEVRSLRARFRAEVDAAGGTRTAEGVLLWRAPGSMRVKLFTLAGLTVYDAVLVGDAGRVRGVVRQPLADRHESFDLGPDGKLASPDADLALVLWSLWQPRCVSAPEETGDGRGSFRLDARGSRAAARSVTVLDGAVREETLVRAPASPADAPERVVARYDRYDCTAEPPLPRRIEVEAPASGWRARVTIVEQVRNVALDDALFALPDGATDAGADDDGAG